LRERPRDLKCAHDAEPRPPVRRDIRDVAALEADDPVIGVMMPVSMLNSELFPAPFGPISPTQQAWSIVQQISSATITAPYRLHK
jgi:hypothetical protein